MKRALITGITGQDGLYLGELLTREGYEVFGLVSDPADPRTARLKGVLPDATLLNGDLTDFASLARAIDIAQPSEVYNLAAMSFVGNSWENALLMADVNAKGVLSLLEAVRGSVGDSPQGIRFFQASSSEVFGDVQEVPQTEATPLNPRSPYGVAKVFGHHMTVTYREAYGMHASSGILFNHESPRRGPEFVTKKVTMAAAAISRGLQDELVLGNIEAKRDWGFAGDYVRAMWLMLQQDTPDDYVIATGAVHSIRELLDAAFAAAGIDDWTPYLKQDPRFMRPVEAEQSVGDASKARERLGWEPTVDFEALITMMVEADLADLGE
jgi:GDPmannose 4,6-dehydratase